MNNDQVPRKKSVALRYRDGDNAPPHVVAKGGGAVAESILAIAAKHRIPLYEDPDLVEVLYAIDMGRIIPPDLYIAISEVLAFLYNVNKSKILKDEC